MRKNTLLGTALILTICASAQDVKEVKSDIKEVTVFLSGAQITREATITLSSGTTDLKFTDLSYYAQPASIQIEGNDDFTIISVSHNYNYMQNREESAEVTEIKEELEGLNRQVTVLNSTEKVYNDEKAMILANKSISGTRTGVDPETLIDLADYYEGRLKDIAYNILEAQTARTDVNEQINELNRQLNEINGSQNTYTSEINASVSTGSTRKVTIRFTYVVSQAGWTPLYDVRSDDINGPITLTYKGDVWQRTGYDWNDVNISLSTGNPTQSGTKPELYPWVVSLYDPSAYRDTRYDNGYSMAKSEAYSSARDVDDELEEVTISSDMTQSLANYTTVVQNTVNTTFNIALPYTIPSNGVAYAVEVQDHEITADYSYYGAPKFDCDGFLMAKITGWDDLNLMPGEANVFYEGTYVGESYLNTNVTTDTLELSMGRDKGVVLERKKIKDYEAPQTLGSNRKITLAIEISVRNNKGTAIQLELQDQIPISSHKDIVVEVLDDGDAVLNTTTGTLTWDVELAKGESRTFLFTYTIKYPKDQELSNY